VLDWFLGRNGVGAEVGSSSVFSAVHRVARRAVLTLAAVLAVSVLPHVPAQAAPRPSPGRVKDRSVPVSKVPVRRAGSSPSDGEQWKATSPVWPTAGAAVVAVPSAAGRAAVTRVGGLPVRVLPEASSSLPAPGQVRVEVLDRAKALAAGVPVLLRVDRADAGASMVRAQVEVDYSGFRDAFGADWASRLRLVQLAPCASPGSAVYCSSPRVLPSRNDRARGVVSASVDFADTTGADVNSSTVDGTRVASGATMALTAADEGETGSFKRTSLAQSYGWQAGESGGAFTFSYPLAVPPSPGDLKPEVSFGYSSGSVDGRTNGESGQTSWLGEGWGYEPGYIERSYRGCKDDAEPAPTYPTTTPDVCWRNDNATIVWQGKSTDLIRDDATGGWRLADDDGSRVELLQDGTDWNAADMMLSPGDFDGDGKADLLQRRAADSNLYLVRGNGTGGWVDGQALKVGTGWGGVSAALAPGDFNGDGNPDVIFRRASDNLLFLLKGNGKGGWVSDQATQIGSGWADADNMFSPGDFSGDGKPDLLYRRMSNSNLYMVRGNGAGGWITGQSEQIGTAWGNFDMIFSPGDFTGDGKSDVIYRDGGNKNLYMFKGNGAGGWTGAATQIGTGWGNADIIFARGSFDSDGKPDVFARQTASKDLTFFQGNGAGGWLTAQGINTTQAVRHGNGDDNGERWRLTTTDGTQYYFGLSLLPGWTAGQRETASTWTAPVFANHAGEPCYRPGGFAGSRCSQAWRWNLDYVVDPHQNSMSYWYGKEQSRTAMAGNVNSVATYERGGWLDRIEYGTRAGQEVTGTPPMRVTFTVADRCLTSCWSGSNPNTANWPDTPWDLNCAVTATSCPTNVSPTFWTTKRLAKVTTQVWDGSTHQPVDEWAINHQFPTTGESSVSPALWLSNIVHTGKDGASLALPPLDFGGTAYANRTDYNLSTGVPKTNRYRITRMTNEHGGETAITYEGSDCTVAAQADPDNNSKRCFPQYYYPPLAPAEGWSWWNKYRVTKVVEKDLVGGSPDLERSYDYSTAGSSSTVLWHHSDGPATWSAPLAKRSWSDFRGWPTVTVTTGAAGQTQSQTTSLYYRGMDADMTDAGEATRDVKTTNSLGEVSEDHSHLAGFLHEQIDLNGAGGQAETKTITEAWQQQTAHRQTDPLQAQPSHGYAYYTKPGTTRTLTRLAASSTWRTAQTVNTYDTTYGTVTRTEERGDTATPDDDTCVSYQYARNTTAWLIDFPSEQVTTNCAATPGPADTLAGKRTYYDSNPVLGQISTRGLATKTEDLASFSGSTPTYVKSSTATYDAHGRPLTEGDALDRVTSTAYTPATGGPATTVQVTNPLLHVTKTALNPMRGAPTSVVDANDKTTTAAYDPLGRLTKVWMPGQPTNGTPNAEYVYAMSATAASNVQTKRLGPTGNQISSFEIYDGLLHLRQTQTTAPDGKRTIADVAYDTRGLAVKKSTFYNNACGPTSVLTSFADAEVPTQQRVTYDAMERQTVDALWSLNTFKWQTTTSYDGDRVDVDPPTGSVATTAIVDATGRRTALRQYKGTSPSGAYDETSYTYDRLDRVVGVTDAAGNAWTYSFDLRGRQTGKVDPDAGTSTSTFDSAGQLITSTDGRGEVLARVYDDLGRLKELHDDTVTGPLRASYLYDTLAKGQLTSSTRHVGSDAYTRTITGYTDRYAPTGATVTIPAVEGNLASTYSTAASYNPDGSPATVDLPGVGGLPTETLTYGYSSAGLPTALTGASTYLASTEYAWDQTVARRYLGAAGKQVRVTDTRDDATRRLTTSQVDTENQTTPGTFVDKSTTEYGYDQAGNVVAIAGKTNGVRDQVECFRYDYLRRLSDAWTEADWSCTTPQRAGADPYRMSWTYDTVGIRKTQTSWSATGTTTATSAYPAAGGAKPHSLTRIDYTGETTRTDTYDYDNAGNTTTRTVNGVTQTLTWDPEGHVATTSQSGQDTSYVYDADGKRLLRRDSGGTTLYFGDTELRLKTNGQIDGTRYYNHGTATVAVRTVTGLSWLIADHHGTNQLTIDPTSLTVTRRRTMPFGEARGAQPAGWPGDKGFVGGTSDPTGLTHLGAREYDPTTGRFTSLDPIFDLNDPGGWNGYAYAGNNPATFSDPSGLTPCLPGEPCGAYKPGCERCNQEVKKSGKFPCWPAKSCKDVIKKPPAKPTKKDNTKKTPAPSKSDDHKSKDAEAKPSTSQKIAQGIAEGASWLADKISWIPFCAWCATVVVGLGVIAAIAFLYLHQWGAAIRAIVGAGLNALLGGLKLTKSLEWMEGGLSGVFAGELLLKLRPFGVKAWHMVEDVAAAKIRFIPTFVNREINAAAALFG
jgi:RHS repeat-associated protein